MSQAAPVKILPLVTCFCPWSTLSCHIIRSEEAVSYLSSVVCKAATADIAASPSSPSQRWDYGPA